MLSQLGNKLLFRCIYLNTSVCTAATSNKTNGLGSCGPEGKIAEFMTDEANTLTTGKYTQANQNCRLAHSPKANSPKAKFGLYAALQF